MVKTEANCRNCGAYLDHALDNWSHPTHLRYCINFVSLNLERGE